MLTERQPLFVEPGVDPSFSPKASIELTNGRFIL
jgi:hypothetical protein